MFRKITEEDKIEITKVLGRFKKPKTEKEIFYNLCFAICAPQAKFKNNLLVQEKLMNIDFFEQDISLETLKPIVKLVRFQKKADYLLKLKNNFQNIKGLIKTFQSNPFQLREILVSYISGIGYKAASHFLRNLGATNLAIIDTHILKVLNKKQGPKNRKEYLEFEKEFEDLAKNHNMTIAELDVFIWKTFSKTSWEDIIF